MRIPLALRRLWKVCPKQRIRYALDTIQCSRGDDGKATIVVTDGKLLIVADLLEGVPPADARPGFSANVPASLWRLAFKLTKSDGTGIIIGETDPCSIGIGNENIAALPVKNQKKFPDWRNIIAMTKDKPVAETQGEGLLLAPSVLATLTEVLTDIGVSSVRLKVLAGKDSPIAFSAKGGDGFRIFGCVMPLSGD